MVSKRLLILLGVASLMMIIPSIITDYYREKNEELMNRVVLTNINEITDYLNMGNFSYYNYKENRNYQTIVKLGYEGVDILTELYFNDNLDDFQKTVAELAITEIMNCDLDDDYIFDWDIVLNHLNNTSNECPLITDTEVNKALLDSKETKIVNKYSDLSTILKQNNIELPEDIQNMVPQGITVMNEYVIVSAYSPKGYKTKCFVLTKMGALVNIVTLDVSAHAGGISYDKENDLIWLSGPSGKLIAYDAYSFIAKEKIERKYTFTSVSKGLNSGYTGGKESIAYLTVYDGHIYIGNFTLGEIALIKKYEIVKIGRDVELKFVSQFNVPSFVQGVSFYKSGDEEYMLLSRSYGRRSTSHLNVYKYDEKIKSYFNRKPMKIIKLPPMLEQNTVVGNNIYTVFESGVKKYSNGKDRTNNVYIFDIRKILVE